MIKFRIDIGDALERAGLNTYKVKKTKILSQNTYNKLKKGDTRISLESLNRVCAILDMQPKDLICYEADSEELEKLFNTF